MAPLVISSALIGGPVCDGEGAGVLGGGGRDDCWHRITYLYIQIHFRSTTRL